MEMRPLPPATRLQQDFREWVSATPGNRVRLYEVVLPANAQQLNYRHEIGWGETPLGRAPSTLVCFDYADATNGMYRFRWSRPGKHDTEWLKMAGQPLRLLVRPLHLGVQPLPEVCVEAVQGLEASGVFIATDDEYLLSTATNSWNFGIQH
jgi:hypothetical protein